MNEVACPLCGGLRYEVLYQPWRQVRDPQQLFGTSTEERGTQQIVRCTTPACGMVYVSPRHEDVLIQRGYQEAAGDSHDSQYASRVQTFYRSLKKHASWLPARGARVLDIGCAGGSFIEAAKRFGYEATGLEPSGQLVKSAQERGLDVRQGSLEAFSEDRPYDLITLWDVIEHVTDPNALMLQVRRVLSSEGTLLINYPDVGTFQARVAGKNFWWFLSPHLYYYTRSTMQNLLRRHGFDVVSMRRHIQRLQLGHLLDKARMYAPKGVEIVKRLMPGRLLNYNVPYYASQTTVVAKRRRSEV